MGTALQSFLFQNNTNTFLRVISDKTDPLQILSQCSATALVSFHRTALLRQAYCVAIGWLKRGNKMFSRAIIAIRRLIESWIVRIT